MAIWETECASEFKIGFLNMAHSVTGGGNIKCVQTPKMQDMLQQS